MTLFASKLHAQESQTGYNFLRLPVSAHAAALGGDNVTLIEDDEALIFQNPALLSSVSDKTINLNYMNYMSGVNTASASFNRIIKEKASWAVSAQYMDYGNMKETDANNNILGDFSAKDITIAGYFSYMLSEKLLVVLLPNSSLHILATTILLEWVLISVSIIMIPSTNGLFLLLPRIWADR